MLLCSAKSCFYQFYVTGGGLGTARRLLLERVQDVHGFSKSHCIDRAVGVPVVISDDLKHAGAPKAAQRFRVNVLVSDLGSVQGKAHDPSDPLWEFANVFQT